NRPAPAQVARGNDRDLRKRSTAGHDIRVAGVGYRECPRGGEIDRRVARRIDARALETRLLRDRGLGEDGVREKGPATRCRWSIGDRAGSGARGRIQDLMRDRAARVRAGGRADLTYARREAHQYRDQDGSGDGQRESCTYAPSVPDAGLGATVGAGRNRGGRGEAHGSALPDPGPDSTSDGGSSVARRRRATTQPTPTPAAIPSNAKIAQDVGVPRKFVLAVAATGVGAVKLATSVTGPERSTVVLGFVPE